MSFGTGPRCKMYFRFTHLLNQKRLKVNVTVWGEGALARKRLGIPGLGLTKPPFEDLFFLLALFPPAFFSPPSLGTQPQV